VLSNGSLAVNRTLPVAFEDADAEQVVRAYTDAASRHDLEAFLAGARCQLC
jgi:hypothetical protein